METAKIETNKPATKTKSKNNPMMDSLRILKETKKKILAEVAELNKKPFGKPITPDQYISLAKSLLKPEHLKQLQDQSLTATDRFEIRYKEYCSQNGKVSKDDFLGTLLGG